MVFAAFWCAGAVQAANVDFSLTSLGGDLWRYDYTLVNSADGPLFDEFTIYFELAEVQQIVTFTAPAGWNALAVQVDPGLPDNGFFDAVHNGGPGAVGSRTSGFSVDFLAVAGLTPSAQRFDLMVSDPFEVVASGITTAVPEPGSYALMLAGLGGLALWARRRPRRSAPGRGAAVAGALS